MSESVVIEVFENQFYSSISGWAADSKLPWSLRSFEPCNSPEEFILPRGEWVWVSDWRVDKRPGATDEDGWEYASRFQRFKETERISKPAKLLLDTARRRCWSRVMRREAGIGKSADLSKVMPKIQFGLKSVNAARRRIEEIMAQAPESGQNDVMKGLISSVQKIISDIDSLLNQVERQDGTSKHVVVIKKLRHDLEKEEAAILRAIDSDAATKSSAAGVQRKTSYGEIRQADAGVLRSSSSSKATLGTSRGNAAPASGSPRREPAGPKISRRNSEEAAQKQAVKGGSADAFSAVMTASGSTGGRDSLSAHSLDGDIVMEDGVFMDRAEHERRIEQMLKPVEEAAVMQELIDERAEAIAAVHAGLVQVNEMFADLSRIVKEQQPDIDSVYNNVDETHVRTAEAYNHIVEANKLQSSGPCAVS